MGIEGLDNYEILVLVVLGILIYSLGIYMLTILYSNRNKFPYKIISPLWVITFIISKFYNYIKVFDIMEFSRSNSTYSCYYDFVVNIF